MQYGCGMGTHAASFSAQNNTISHVGSMNGKLGDINEIFPDRSKPVTLPIKSSGYPERADDAGARRFRSFPSGEAALNLQRSGSYMECPESPRSGSSSPKFPRSVTREFSDSRSGSFCPRASDVATSFSPVALDKLCEVVDGAKVTFLGTPVFSQGDRVIVSFPGAHGRAWNRLMQGAGGWKTSCVFLPDKSTPGYGVHATSYFNGKVENSCFCDMLYGETVDWGCRWFQMWMENTRRAEEMNCELVVVTKPDGSLGRSQSGEVEFLRKSGYKYQERSVRQFAEDVLSVFLADLRAEGEGKSVRIRTSSRCRLPSVPRYMSTEDSDESFSLEVLSGLEVRQSFTLQ